MIVNLVKNHKAPKELYQSFFQEKKEKNYVCSLLLEPNGLVCKKDLFSLKPIERSRLKNLFS